MKTVNGWHVPDNMNTPGSHLRRSGVITLAVAHLPMDRRRTVIQAGGHIGIWPHTLASIFDLVFTYEPIGANIECLVANCAHVNNVKLTPGCIGDKDGFVEVEFCERNTGKHCVRRGGPKHADVQMTQLDSEFRHSTNVDALFLDIEGYEWQALMGGERMIDRCHPLIVVEQNGLGSRYGHADNVVTQLLTDWGYQEVEEFEEDVVYVHRSRL